MHNKCMVLYGNLARTLPHNFDVGTTQLRCWGDTTSMLGRHNFDGATQLGATQPTFKVRGMLVILPGTLAALISLFRILILLLLCGTLDNVSLGGFNTIA